jgi:hypothetical protein
MTTVSTPAAKPTMASEVFLVFGSLSFMRYVPVPHSTSVNTATCSRGSFWEFRLFQTSLQEGVAPAID